MKIIIIGAGKVGCQIAKTLSSENHDVVIIEKDDLIRQSAQNSLDVLTILGNGANVHTLEEAGIRQADMIIAVTNIDEVNMIACMTAKQLGVPKKIARIRNPEYIHNNTFSIKQLGIDFIINPEIATAKEIVNLLRTPANIAQIQDFAEGKNQMLELKIEENFPFINKQLKDLIFEFPLLVAAIYRKDKIIIPGGEEKIKKGDNLYVLVEKGHFLELDKILSEKFVNTQNVIILGGSKIGFQTALRLGKLGINTKLIERDKEKCQEIAQRLPHTLVINGDGTNIDLLQSEGIETTDGFVSVTGYDEDNLLVALLAKHLGAKKVIAKVDRANYVPILEKIGVHAVVNPRMTTASAILRFIRRGEILSLTLLKEGEAEIIELIAQPTSKIINKPLLKQAYREIHKLIHPKAVTPIRLGDKTISEEVMRNITGFFFTLCIYFCNLYFYNVYIRTGYSKCDGLSCSYLRECRTRPRFGWPSSKLCFYTTLRENCFNSLYAIRPIRNIYCPNSGNPRILEEIIQVKIKNF